MQSVPWVCTCVGGLTINLGISRTKFFLRGKDVTPGLLPPYSAILYTFTCLLRCCFYWKEYSFYFRIISGTTLSSLPNITGLANLGTSPTIYWIEHWKLIMTWQVDKLVLITMWRVDKLVLMMMWRVDKLVLMMIWQVNKFASIIMWRVNKLVSIMMLRVDKLVLIMMWWVDKLVLIMMWQVDKLILMMMWQEGGKGLEPMTPHRDFLLNPSG